MVYLFHVINIPTRLTQRELEEPEPGIGHDRSGTRTRRVIKAEWKHDEVK